MTAFLTEKPGRRVLIPDNPQFIDAIGAALWQWNVKIPWSNENDGRAIQALPMDAGLYIHLRRRHNGATWAVKLGYKNVYRYPGGIFAWKGAKYPMAEVK